MQLLNDGTHAHTGHTHIPVILQAFFDLYRGLVRISLAMSTVQIKTQYPITLRSYKKELV